MLYLANFSDWSLASFNGKPNRISAYGILRMRYPKAVTVPNVGMNLEIFSSSEVDLFAPYDLDEPILTAIPTPYTVGFSSKNSINANDYILGPPAAGSPVIQVFLEVG